HLRGRPPGDSAGLQLGYVLAMEFQHGEILRLKALALSSRALILEGPEEQQGVGQQQRGARVTGNECAELCGVVGVERTSAESRCEERPDNQTDSDPGNDGNHEPTPLLRHYVWALVESKHFGAAGGDGAGEPAGGALDG